MKVYFIDSALIWFKLEFLGRSARRSNSNDRDEAYENATGRDRIENLSL
jgi:hypothetical protein